MLTLEINDAQLERKIIKKAKAIGKSVHELVKDIVSEKIEEDSNMDILPFDVPKLDYRKYIKIIDKPFDDQFADDEPLFQNASKTIEFAKQLREKAWKRKSIVRRSLQTKTW